MSRPLTHWALGQLSGNAVDDAVLLLLADYADRDGRAYPSAEHVARRLCIRKGAVLDALACHEQAGRIRRRMRLTLEGERTSDEITLRPMLRGSRGRIPEPTPYNTTFRQIVAISATLNLPGRTVRERMLLVSMIRAADWRGRCAVTVEQHAAAIGCGYDTVLRLRRALTDVGLIECGRGSQSGRHGGAAVTVDWRAVAAAGLRGRAWEPTPAARGRIGEPYTGRTDVYPHNLPKVGLTERQSRLFSADIRSIYQIDTIDARLQPHITRALADTARQLGLDAVVKAARVTAAQIEDGTPPPDSPSHYLYVMASKACEGTLGPPSKRRRRSRQANHTPIATHSRRDGPCSGAIDEECVLAPSAQTPIWRDDSRKPTGIDAVGHRVRPTRVEPPMEPGCQPATRPRAAATVTEANPQPDTIVERADGGFGRAQRASFSTTMAASRVARAPLTGQRTPDRLPEALTKALERAQRNAIIARQRQQESAHAPA